MIARSLIFVLAVLLILKETQPNIMYRLVFLTGKFKGKRLAIQEKSVKAGRAPDCAIQLPDDDASRQHAIFEQRDDGVYIRDLKSTNKILVNDVPVREARLNHGDKIELGSTIMQYQLITQSDLETDRSVGHTQTLAAIVVTLVILSQVAFLIYLIARHRDAIQAPEKTLLSAPAVILTETIEHTAPEVDKTLAQAKALLDEREETLRTAPPPPEPDPQVMEDLQALRAEVEGLRQQMEVKAEEPEPPPVITDPLLQRAQVMLNEAAAEIARLNFVQADEQLARIQLMAPDFLPAYIERARLHEQRGQLRQASEQWAQILNRSVGTPLYEQAAAERIRLARAEMMQRTALPLSAETRAARTAGRLPRRIRITSVEQERFPKNDQFEEMRLLRISMRPRPGERDVDAYHFQIVVTFFDENTQTRYVQPTRAVVPKDPLRVEGSWRPNQQKDVTAAYIVPRGFREQEFEQHGEQNIYMGYVVQLYYRQQLQDIEARPKDLIDKLDEIPSPFHKPVPESPPAEAETD